MIDFHVTSEIYDLVAQGKKITEYREFKPHWRQRIRNITIPSKANIFNAYTKEKIPILIINISLIDTNTIENDFYRNFIKTSRCYKIEYEFYKDEAKNQKRLF